MDIDLCITLLISISYIILSKQREQFFFIIFCISIGSNYKKVSLLFKEKSVVRVLIRIILVYVLAYLLIKDPNPFYHLLFFYLPFQNYFRGIFILVFLSYCLSSQESKDYFLPAFFKVLTVKKALSAILLFSMVNCLVYLYNDKLFIYFLNKESAFQSQTFYIVTNLYNSEAILPDWIKEMKQLITFLGAENVIFSAFENNDSTDKTARLLKEFGTFLDKSNISNRIVTDRVVKKHQVERIEFLSQIRNKALDFLYDLPNIDFNHTTILFFNDIIFSYEDIIKLIMTNDQDYDAACGMDYYESFYDTWASYGIDAHKPRYYYPYFVNKVAQDSYINGESLRMFTCWNGVIAFKAKPFQHRKVFFRSGALIRQSECALINADLYELGHKKVIINTQVRVAYEYYYYYMNKYIYPWTKHLFTYFYYYFRYIHIRNNYDIINLKDNDVKLCQKLDEFRRVFLSKIPEMDPHRSIDDYKKELVDFSRYLY